MILSLFNSLRSQLHERWKGTPIPAFFTWWSSELLACVPSTWRHRLSERNVSPIIHWPLQTPLDHEADSAVALLLAADQVLLCQLQLPSQSAHDLRSVLAFELDKYTPFKVDQIYFDAWSQASENQALLQISLVLVERNRLDAAVQSVEAQGLQVVSVDAMSEAGRPYGIDLLPRRHRDIRATRLRHIKYALSVGIGLLVLLLMMTRVGNREKELIEMREQVVSLRTRAMEVDRMRKQLQERTEIEKALVLQDKQKQTSVAFLNELTNCVPTDTWLEQLEMHLDGSVTLSGLSRQSNLLPAELMRCAGLEKATFQGGIQPDRESGLERFNIVAHRRKAGV
ncbi:type II secretion system protein GspL [Pseudomonas kielensis]|uniref:type II secretion system protein GspL n=1 Tax=Pseudomonas kielensis TaxID=2762577 RepID=UPI0038A7B453